MVQQAKHWAFTLNNPTEEDDLRLHTLGKELERNGIHGLIYGNEVGDSGTPHIQGHISLLRKLSASRLKTLIGHTCHVEIARDPKRSWEYCKKDGAFTEFGMRPGGQGRRTDLDSLQQAIKNGSTIKDIQENFFSSWCRYPKAIQAYADLHAEQRQWETRVIIYWGETGTGKTRTVYENAASERLEIYAHPGDMWFDGYTGQELAIFDDFNGSEFKLSYLLKLLDRYPMRVPIKGGYVQWKPRTVYITSNKNPDIWYSGGHPEQRRALMRRISEVAYFRKNQDYGEETINNVRIERTYPNGQ